MNVTGGKLWASTNVDSGIIDNENASLLNVSGGQIIAAKRQAIYNNGGTVNVSGNAYLENGYAITATRSCLQNASGTMNITGGTIISGSTNSLYAAVENNGTMTIGNNDGTIDTTSPVIKGNYYGLIIKSGNTVSYYDGIIKGLNSAIDNENNIVLDNNHNVELIHGQEIINSDTYNTVIIEETGA